MSPPTPGASATSGEGVVDVLLESVVPAGGMYTKPSHSGVRIAAPVCSWYEAEFSMMILVWIAWYDSLRGTYSEE
jgi:hypothetical protein